MKKLIPIIILLLLGALGYYTYQSYYASCSRPVKYSVGVFDTKFGLGKDTFISDLREAEKPWEKALGKNLFEYNAGATFKVNLVYDERQRETALKQRTESGLTQSEAIFRQADERFVEFKSQYKRRSATYQLAKNAFDSRSAEYENQVKYWNTQGGAPKKEFEQLEDTRRSLNTSASQLNNEAEALNSMTSQLNALLTERNKLARDYNSLANNYNNEFGHGLEFNQAEYTGKEINVYQFNNSRDLTLAMSHEFGHSLGMDHVENSKSIMYYLTEEQASTTLTPTTEDVAELNRACSSGLSFEKLLNMM